MPLRMALLLFLLGLSTSSQAWWGGYGPYSPGAWPGYGYAPYGQNWGYGGSDWNVKGVMNEWGDTHFVIEYHGNIYDDMTGSSWGRRPYGLPGYARPGFSGGGFPGYGGYGLPYSGNPYFGGWR